MSPSAQEVWDDVSAAVRTRVTDTVWHTTFSEITAVSYDGEALVLAAPSLLVRDRASNRFRVPVTEACVEAGHGGLDVIFELAERPDDHIEVTVDAYDAPTTNYQDPPRVPASNRPVKPVEPFNPKYSFESFVVGPSNRFAAAAALSVAETPSRSYNPLFVYGAAGLGKTHLLQAIANYVREIYPAYRVRYISSEEMLNDFVDAIRQNTTSEFKRRFRDIDVLLVDDIQFMEGKERLQEEFFHTFNTLHEANRQIVLSSDRPPDAIRTLEERLRSRFKMGLITDIQAPDLETRMAIVRKKAEGVEPPINDDVLAFVATNITNNIRELEGALTRLSAYVHLYKQSPTLDNLDQALGDVVTARRDRQIKPDDILTATAEKYGFTVQELISRSRRRPLVTARQVAMYLFRELTHLSYPETAKVFGGRDHTTVIHAYEKIKNLMKERTAIYEDVQELIQQLKLGGYG